ncbi:methyltransferase domain-containing protein [Candidatus Berkiella aquae]|uniref:Bifunctional 3-demethylubiquinone-9 3-methyltransferase/ 2-octaprenyl-6-hydroxy phenol methylase n=1 Tax=Candidatus Berkiella aquae TaxID=295108 RepID=A0A0Q9YX88_9GAMM|nr:class I SAM-dependent methyltransferase [Candidatus Berkiella aquae]MCS5712445.1 class I SAM-dependent methyltransferase [Candidatus Berkiella aquae]
MNKLQQLIYNNGERLIPYISHDDSELVRHRSSYVFFYNVMQSDSQKNRDDISIIDLGFGCGYGTAILSSLPRSKITGVDISPECEIFANQYYYRNNVEYIIDDLSTFMPNMALYDYVVSRGVLEHVPHGLKLIEKIKFNHRIMIDVPYDETPGNEHHVLTGIKEDDFAHLDNIEIFYEDLEGRIYLQDQKPQKPNMIMIVISDPKLPKVSSLFNFPIAPINNNELETLNLDKVIKKKHYFEKPIELLNAVEKAIKESDVVLDIGCGIRPMNYFKPKLHILVEPHQEYIDILTYRNSGDKSVISLQQNALQALTQLADQSVDSIFLLDVIEHINKEEGLKIIQACERVAREQIVIFTPLGFMPQHVHEEDAWGLNGGKLQEHISGWTPADFGTDWAMYICNDFHAADANGLSLKKPFGAFFAIRDCNPKHCPTPEKLGKLRIPIFSAFDSHRLHKENIGYQQQYVTKDQECNGLYDKIQSLEQINQTLESELNNQTNYLNNQIKYLNNQVDSLNILNQQHERTIKSWQTAYQAILNSKSIRFVKFLKKLNFLSLAKQETAS